MTATQWNILGLLMVLGGVLLLFRYGMPYRVRSEGDVYLVTGEKNQADRKQERLYAILGWVGLVLVVLGTISQIKAALIGAFAP
jgi:hypothetical protein